MSHLVQVTAHDERWRVVPEHRDQLLGPGGLRLAEWLRDGRAEVVKHGPHRTVYRVRLPDLCVYVKHNRLHDLRAWLRELLRPSKAAMEFERARAVAACGVATISPVAVGECRGRFGPGDSFLVTHSLDDTEPLSSFIETTLPAFPPARQTRVRLRLAVELGRLLARMHDAGIVHNDLHAGNLLVCLDRDDRPCLFLIDLHAVRLRSPLGWTASRANLVVLNRWFVLRVGRTDRLRFWRAYCAAREGKSAQTGPELAQYSVLSTQYSVPSTLHPSQAADLARDLERRTWASNLRFWRNRDRRCLVSNRYYARVRTASVAGYRVTDLDPEALRPLLDDPDEPFRRVGVKLLKDSPSSTVAELVLPVNGVPRPVIYKRFRLTGWGGPWKSLLRRSPALRSWVLGHGLRERCLPTARPLAVFHRRRNGLDHEGYLITEKIADAAELQRFAASLEHLTPRNRQRALRLLIEQVARLVRELHRRHLSHRDLKAANILVREGGPGTASHDAWGVSLIDLVGVDRCRRLPRRRRVQNLARLHASFFDSPLLTRTDKLRFLRVYFQWGLSGRHRWKRWWREIESATLAKVARNACSGRLLA